MARIPTNGNKPCLCKSSRLAERYYREQRGMNDMTINTQGASQTLIEDQQANIKTLTELNLNQARTIEEQQAQIEHLKSEHEKWDALASRENERLQAQVKELEAAPIKINVKSRDVWITFNAGGGRQSML